MQARQNLLTLISIKEMHYQMTSSSNKTMLRQKVKKHQITKVNTKR